MASPLQNFCSCVNRNAAYPRPEGRHGEGAKIVPWGVGIEPWVKCILQAPHRAIILMQPDDHHILQGRHNK